MQVCVIINQSMYAYVCMNVFLYGHMYACMFVCKYVCTCLCIYKWMDVSRYGSVWLWNMNVSKHVGMYTCKFVCMC